MGYKFVSHFQPHVLSILGYSSNPCTLGPSVGWGWRGASYYLFYYFRCLLGAIHLGIASCLIVSRSTGNRKCVLFFFFFFFILDFALWKGWYSQLNLSLMTLMCVLGDTPQTVILCPKIHPSPWATFSKHPFSSDSLGHHPWGFLLNPEVRFTEKLA